MKQLMPMFHQRTLNFDPQQSPESDHVATTTSLPPPLVRPDRQFTFDGLPHYEWPAPQYDRDTISVDRIREDIDGPSHRFLIQRGDTVEAFLLSNKQTNLGEVVGISHANEEVCVRFAESTAGIWFHKGQIYPAVEPLPDHSPHQEPLSHVINRVNAKQGADLTEADRIPMRRAFTFDDFKQFHRAMSEGTIRFATYREEFSRLLESEAAIVTELKSRFNAKQLTVLASRLGSWHARGNTKDQNAKDIYRKMMSAFLLDSAVSYSLGERYEDALQAKVLAVTEEQFQAHLDQSRVEANELKQALANPASHEDFLAFIRHKGEADLSDDQLARYDAFEANLSREQRQRTRPATVEQFQNQELSEQSFRIKEGYHDKRQCPLFIVQLTTRVERAAFDELNRKAKMLGGWFSSFKRDDAGFQFLDQERANRFASLLHGDTDRSDVLLDRKSRGEQTAAERLHELATTLHDRAEETVEHSQNSLQNTARRADIQAGIRGRAFADQALARTLHSIAEALSTHEATYLDGIRHKAQVEALDTVLRLAKWAHFRAVNQPSGDQERVPNLLDVRFAKYPYPVIYKRHLEDAVAHCRNKSGAKLTAQKMSKRLKSADEYVTFQSEHDVESLTDFLARATDAKFATEWLNRSLELYQRLQRANITNIHELRSALREYLPHKAEARGDNPVQVAERELIGKPLPGFFPTPSSVIDEMLELASINSTHRVLEPSCGKGDILDAIRNRYPDADLHAMEFNHTLADVLAAKGHTVEFGDFLEHAAQYDRIVMNPPFENGQDMDHVRHAYECLGPGGRVVSVMSEGSFFRADKKAAAFRDWLAAVGGVSSELPADTFQGPEAFRQTSVRTRLVAIDKSSI